MRCASLITALGGEALEVRGGWAGRSFKELSIVSWLVFEPDFRTQGGQQGIEARVESQDLLTEAENCRPPRERFGERLKDARFHL